MPLRHRCGLKLSPQPPSLRFGAYFSAAMLPQVPQAFGHYDNIPPKSWNMYDNDRLADCTIAGAFHATMLWNSVAGKFVKFTALDAVDDYRDACGYVPGNPSTDNGGDMVAVASYWKTTGMRDWKAARHTISAYLQIDATNLEHIHAAAYLFGAVGLGVQLTSSSESQFESCQPWSIVAGDTPDDYHYVPLVGRDASYSKVVTWGALQDVEAAWLAANCKEAIAMISPEYLVDGKTLEGFDMAALQSDLAAIG